MEVGLKKNIRDSVEVGLIKDFKFVGSRIDDKIKNNNINQFGRIKSKEPLLLIIL